jgi:hypothetical protein
MTKWIGSGLIVNEGLNSNITSFSAVDPFPSRRAVPHPSRDSLGSGLIHHRLMAVGPLVGLKRWHLPKPRREISFGPMYTSPSFLAACILLTPLQGLRGIASVLVVTAHICRSLVPHLLSPAMSDKLPPTLFQLPFFRCLVMGRASVAAFALLAGYVNSLKPIKLSRAGSADAALSSVAKSSFRRTGRFVIPAIIATICSWLACQFGGYKVAHVADSAWIRDTSPTPSASFAAAFYDLFQNLGTTWLDGFNAYDRIQWTLTYLLKGSMMTYLTLFATVYVKPVWRVFICVGLYWFEWEGGDGERTYPFSVPRCC